MATRSDKLSDDSQLITMDLSDIPNLPTNLLLPESSTHYESGSFTVHQLLLRRNALTSLKPYANAIDKLKESLFHLSLRENKLSHFPIETILLPNLTSLSSADNNITMIEDGIFSQLPNLQWLNLSKNSLKTLPSDLASCYQLRGIDVTDNSITKFPGTVFSLPYLKALLLDRNKISVIPSYFKFPPTLEVLSIASNMLSEMPWSLIYSPPKKLAHLNISGSLLKELPVDFLSVGYEKLTSLDMHSCQLTSFPSWAVARLCARGHLRRLNLALNQLTEIPAEISSLKTLQWLNLNANLLTHLPVSMSALVGLVKLGIAQNHLETIPPLMFIHMQRLEKLDIRRNRLRYFPPSIMSTIKIHNRFVNHEIFVPQAVFSSFDLRSTCSRHVSKPSYYDTLFGNRVCDYCHPFGGELDDLFFAGNLRLQYVTGIICESQENDCESIQIISLSNVFSILEELSEDSSQETMKASLRKFIFSEENGTKNMRLRLTNMEYCDSPRFSRRLYSLPNLRPTSHAFNELTQQEMEMIESRIRSLLITLPSLQDKALHTHLNATLGSFFDGSNKDYEEYVDSERRLDHSPERTRQFIGQVLSDPYIPAFVKDKAIETCQQCDYCLRWTSHSNIKVGYISVLPESGVKIPIRYHICSFDCALDSLVNLYTSTRDWQAKHRRIRAY
ncbi:hypothetical protein G6F46_009758 [Rhizopus delemar]|nr:hypothetical protein G6F46_009758 [Rhizopus delemar]